MVRKRLGGPRLILDVPPIDEEVALTAFRNTFPSQLRNQCPSLTQLIARGSWPHHLPLSPSQLWNQSLVVSKDEELGSGMTLFMGSKSEIALLSFTKELKWTDSREGRNATVVRMIRFSREWKVMGVVIKVEEGTTDYM
ncbi:hypothetical protein SCLCIDRAFT_29010 [Scleroderma citrinum Foug A]|uniref:Uncharacterized protein n=1 Tax=Scleroderma citrinum Foug A TaxID=1036808 RepID=A0A0C2Z5E9_9AGAM|nr:hypothetical protein SCLCIDRAFT_29010 [Scleroderma citrinum Foug A]